MLDMAAFIQNMPKAELHVHIEGTIQPGMLLEMAARNSIDLPYKTESELLAAQDYGHPHLVNFLRHHYERVQVLRTGRDIHDITLALIKKCRDENIRHVELMFDPQVHLEQGMTFEEMMEGLQSGRDKGEREYGVSSLLIMCANRDRPPQDAVRMLELAANYRQFIAGIGIDSYEQDNPPLKFREFFERGRKEGYRLTAHCDVDQENSPEHIRQCIHDLEVERIDHGVNCVESDALVEDLKSRNICLTVCPTWRISDPGPRRVKRLRQMFDRGLAVTINTDDPEEFASRYLTNTMMGVQQASDYTPGELIQLMRYAFLGSWGTDQQKQTYLDELETYAQRNGVDQA